MAMTEAQVVGAEMEKVSERLPVAFEQEGTFFNDVPKRTDVEVVSARSARVPMKIRPGGRSGAVDIDGGGLGRGSGPIYDKATIDVVATRHAVEITKKAQWATNDPRKARINALRKAMTEELDEFIAQTDRWCMTSGDGVMAVVSAVATSGGKDLITCAASGNGFGVRLLRDNCYYGVFDTTLATKRTWTGGTALNGEGEVDFYDPENNQIRFNVTATSAGVIAGDKLVVSGLSATPVWINGVPYHHSNASTGTWEGLNRANYPMIRSNGVNANSGPLSLPYARLAVNKVRIRLGKKQVKKLKAWMHPGQVDAYERLGQLVHHIQRPSGTSDPGLSLYFDDNMQIAGAKVMDHANWDKTRIDFIAPELWGRTEMQKMGFYEEDGRKLFEARTSDGGVATATIFYYVNVWQLFHENPAGGAYIYGLTVPNGYNS